MTVHQNLSEIFKSHRLIWNNESYRKLAINILTNIGVNLILNGDETISGAVCTAQAIIAIEHYNGKVGIESVINSREVISKSRDLYYSSSCIRRDILKFYRKRTTCKCLKKMHLEARKSTPKMGFCWVCDKDMERVLLSLCSRCMVSQYCSRECQVAAWPDHRRSCNEYVELTKNSHTEG